MPALSMEAFEQTRLDVMEFDITAKIKTFNTNFVSKVNAENGYFGRIDGATKNTLVRAEFKKAFDFLDHPEHILGSNKTKFGEIAERIEVAMKNADDIADGKTPRATFDVPRTGPVDIMVDGKPIQMKFYNGNGTRTLNAVIESINKGGAYADNTFYIPKDQYATLEQVSNHYKAHGKVSTLQIEVNGTRLRGTTLEKMLSEIQEIETKTGKKFSDAVKPASTDYKDVQLETAKKTLQAKQRAALKTIAAENLKYSREAGVNSGLSAAGITAAISTVDNIRGVISGEITAQEAFVDVAKDTGTAAAIGYGTGFISSAVASATRQSSHTLIRTLCSANVASAAISFGIDSYDSVIDYAQGKIDEKQLAYKLGESAVGVAGATAGASIGVAAGSVVPVVGTIAGGLVGGMVGYAVATGTYATAVEVVTGGAEVLEEKAESVAAAATEVVSVVSDITVDAYKVSSTAISGAYETASTVVAENAEALKDKALEMSQSVIDAVADTAPEALGTVTGAMNDFAASLNLPFHF